MSSLQKVFVSEIKRLAHAEVNALLKDLRKKVADQAREIKALTATIKTMGVEVVAPAERPKAAILDFKFTPERQQALVEKFNKNTMNDLARKSGLTQRQIAILLGTSLVSVSKWTSGKAMPRDAMKATIVELLSLDKAAIIARLPEEARENRKTRHQKAVRRKASAKAAKARSRNAAKGGGKKIRKARVKKVPSTSSISSEDAVKDVAYIMNMNTPVSE